MTKILMHAILGALAGPVVALDLAPPDPVCTIVDELSAQVLRITGYPMQDVCNDISFTLPAVARDELGQLGAFHPSNGRIELAANLDLTTTYGQSILLHEMVHAAQAQSGFSPDCRARLEVEAYRAQSTFLRAHNLENQANAALFFATILSTCAP